MTCDWCGRPASKSYAIRGRAQGSEGYWVRACRTHARTAETAVASWTRPEPPPVTDEAALFDTSEYRA